MDRVVFKQDACALRASVKQSQQRYARVGAGPLTIILLVLTWAIAGSLIGFATNGNTRPMTALIAIGVVMLVVCPQLATLAMIRRWIQHMGARPNSETRYEVLLTVNGIRFQSQHTDTFIRWPAVASAGIVGQHVAIDLPMGQVIAIPCAAIGARTECEAFVAAIRTRIQQAQRSIQTHPNGAGDAAPSTSPSSEHAADSVAEAEAQDQQPTRSDQIDASDQTLASGLLPALTSNLACGARMLSFMKVEPHRVRAGPLELIALLLTLVAVKLIADLTALRFEGQFQPWGLWGTAAMLGTIVLGAWLINASVRQRQSGFRMIAAAVAGTVFLTIIEEAVLFVFESRIDRYSGRPWHGHTAIQGWSGVWLFIALAVLVFRWMPGEPVGSPAETDRRPLALLVAFVFGLTVRSYGPMGNDLVMPHWDRLQAEFEHDTDQLKTMRAPMRESVLYGEERLLNAALTALAPQTPGAIDLYWLGVGGWGNQDVFMHETRVAQNLFAEKFHTQGRAITLVNNTSTAGTQPFASVTAIERALAHIGSKMDPQEDVLFLFVTSHGSAERGVSLRMAPYDFDDLPPEKLKAMLDAAGIGWRVIVVSACHSGVFIPSLADDRTLIITASAADRKSFGCTNDATLTYFGRALLEESMPKHQSFLAAFDEARKLVSAREAREKLDASNPQLHAGPAVIEHLKRFEAQLSRASNR